MDEFLKDEKFDFIFMDIEGSEEPAMRGMPRLISQTKVLVSEFLPHLTNQLKLSTVPGPYA